MILVSVDDDTVEPSNVFEDRVPVKYRDRVLKLVWREDGLMALVYEGQEILDIAANAVARRPREETSEAVQAG